MKSLFFSSFWHQFLTFTFSSCRRPGRRLTAVGDGPSSGMDGCERACMADGKTPFGRLIRRPITYGEKAPPAFAIMHRLLKNDSLLLFQVAEAIGYNDDDLDEELEKVVAAEEEEEAAEGEDHEMATVAGADDGDGER